MSESSHAVDETKQMEMVVLKTNYLKKKQAPGKICATDGAVSVPG